MIIEDSWWCSSRRVRVRGVAATALTRLFLSEGYSVVQPSRIIMDRFGLGFDASPPDVTVKDSGEDELLVVGDWSGGLEVFSLLSGRLGDVFSWASPLGLYSVCTGRVRAKSDGGCVVELPRGVEGFLEDCEADEGSRVGVTIIRPPVKPGERARVSREIRVVGKYVVLIKGSSRVSVSEHIRDPGRRSHLLALAATRLMGSGLGVHFRSSSRFAGDEEILGEIDRLLGVLGGAEARIRNSLDPEIILDGEFIGLIGLTSNAKKVLDDIRGDAAPTIPGHHSYKYGGGCLSDVVDYAETLLSSRIVSGDQLSRSILEYILSRYYSGQPIRILHVTPTGRRLYLTPGTLHSRGEDYIVLRRVFGKQGLYDGLGVEKMPGDVDYMFIPLQEHWLSHNYYRGGDWLGSYVNINTPPELLPGTIKYHDLTVDVVVHGDMKTEIIDREELDTLAEKKIIREETRRKALETAEKIARNPKKHIYQPQTQ